LIILIYVVRLYIQPSVKLNIKCLNIDLLSPTYVTDVGLECHRSPDDKVCAGGTMKSSFIIKSGDWSCGALTCRLQRRQSHESTGISENTSSTTCLLVVWGVSEFNKLYVTVLLVEHEGADWSKDNLEALYRKNANRFRLYYTSITEVWSLNDNTALMTTFEIMNEDRILNITISEVERHNITRVPGHIDPER
jgi:hypothetical protein